MNREMTRRLAIALVLPVVLLSACGGGKQTSATEAKSSASEAMPEIAVLVVGGSRAAAEAASSSPHTVASTLTVEHEADLLAEEEGRLVEVLADQGKRVKKGEVLARLDDSRLRKESDEDRAGMQMLQAKAQQAEVLRQAAEVELQRQAELRKDGLGSQRDYDRARFNLEAMRHEINVARFEAERARAKVEVDDLRLSHMQLRAPFDGIVARRYAHVGQYLLLNEKALRVTDLRPLLVRFTVPESLRAAAAHGALLDVFPADRSLMPSSGGLRARVERTGYVVDAASGSVECTAQLLDPVPEGLLPGMSVEVRLATGGVREWPSQILLPNSSLRRKGAGEAEVFLVVPAAGTPGMARLQLRRVALGRDTSAGVELLSGLSPGDRIATQASATLRDGMLVRPRVE